MIHRIACVLLFASAARADVCISHAPIIPEEGSPVFIPVEHFTPFLVMENPTGRLGLSREHYPWPHITLREDESNVTLTSVYCTQYDNRNPDVEYSHWRHRWLFGDNSGPDPGGGPWADPSMFSETTGPTEHDLLTSSVATFDYLPPGEHFIGESLYLQTAGIDDYTARGFLVTVTAIPEPSQWMLLGTLPLLILCLQLRYQLTGRFAATRQ